MADSSPNPSPPGGERRPASSGELSPSASRASVPPSEPRGSRASLSAIDVEVDRPARLQLIVALLLALVLVAIPLYLWRRPRAGSIAAIAVQDAGAASVEPAPAVAEERLTVTEPRSTCHDPGPKRTPPERCDRLADVERALARAVEESSSCVPKDAGGGTLVFAAEVTLAPKKKSLVLSLPKDGRSIKNARVLAVCQSSVKAKMQAVTLDGLKHEHQRYRINVTATYPGAVKP